MADEQRAVNPGCRWVEDKPWQAVLGTGLWDGRALKLDSITPLRYCFLCERFVGCCELQWCEERMERRGRTGFAAEKCQFLGLRLTGHASRNTGN